MEKSIAFYRDGLGFETREKDNKPALHPNSGTEEKHSYETNFLN